MLVSLDLHSRGGSDFSHSVASQLVNVSGKP